MLPPVFADQDPDEDLEDASPEPELEHDVLIRLRLSNRQMGRAEEREGIEQLGDELEAAVLAAGVGEYDGDEIGGGEAILFFAGKDADKLLAVLTPLLKRNAYGRTAKATLQRGADADPEDVAL